MLSILRPVDGFCVACHESLILYLLSLVQNLILCIHVTLYDT